MNLPCRGKIWLFVRNIVQAATFYVLRINFYWLIWAFNSVTVFSSGRFDWYFINLDFWGGQCFRLLTSLGWVPTFCRPVTWNLWLKYNFEDLVGIPAIPRSMVILFLRFLSVAWWHWVRLTSASILFSLFTICIILHAFIISLELLTTLCFNHEPDHSSKAKKCSCCGHSQWCESLHQSTWPRPARKISRMIVSNWKYQCTCRCLER